MISSDRFVFGHISMCHVYSKFRNARSDSLENYIFGHAQS